MRRYNITPNSAGPGTDDTLRLKVEEAGNGEWVRYEDVAPTECTHTRIDADQLSLRVCLDCGEEMT